MKVWLDDERPAPDGWTPTRWPAEAIAHLKTGQVTHLSLDHDLGDVDDKRTGYHVVLWLEEQVLVHGFQPPTSMHVHSANSSARLKMLAGLARIQRHLRETR